MFSRLLPPPPPLWAFGHGLSYTTFLYETVKTNKQQYSETDTILVSVRIRNTGKRAGKEVIQIYTRDLISSIVTPVRQLKAFTKIMLAPEEMREVTLSIPANELSLTDEQGNRFFEPGRFLIEVGTASDDIKHKMEIIIGNYTKKTITNTPIITNLKKPAGKEIKISGIVRDVQATPIKNVSVCSAYSGKELAVTDQYGQYTLKAASDDRLVFRCNGYEIQSIDIKGDKIINAQLYNN